MRTGIGYDIHRLVPTQELHSIPLGGIPIPCYFRVEAHSDGDVLLHALIDAYLGALALGDIGQRFPDTDPQYKDHESLTFLIEVKKEIAHLGWRVRQMDSIIFLEEPRLKDHHDTMRSLIAKTLDIERSSVSIKAKTMEGLGIIGNRLAIAAQVIIVLESFSK